MVAKWTYFFRENLIPYQPEINMKQYTAGENNAQQKETNNKFPFVSDFIYPYPCMMTCQIQMAVIKKNLSNSILLFLCLIISLGLCYTILLIQKND